MEFADFRALIRSREELFKIRFNEGERRIEISGIAHDERWELFSRAKIYRVATRRRASSICATDFNQWKQLFRDNYNLISRGRIFSFPPSLFLSFAFRRGIPQYLNKSDVTF